ncbi:MAG TPA: Rieske 2Fe-2S domain-containing protein [Candidatus Binatia bacterium]
MSSSLPIKLIEKQHWLEPIEEQLQPTIAAAFDDNGSIGPKVGNILHGTWLGHPLHVVLTDVPIGSWTAAAVFDLLEQTSGSPAMGRKADAAIAFGLIGATAAAVTGLTDWSKVGPSRARRIGLAHGVLNLAATACYVTSLCLRRVHSRNAGRQFAMAGFMISNLSAYLGGHLVYNERIGVDHTAGFSPPKDFFPVLTESELSDNELRRVDADGMPVLLVRRGMRIYAIAETCSHLGGPLAEGELQDTVVKCPWHGSCFSLENGRVVNGPSVHPQPVLEVRVRDGQIEVRGSNR